MRLVECVFIDLGGDQPDPGNIGFVLFAVFGLLGQVAIAPGLPFSVAGHAFGLAGLGFGQSGLLGRDLFAVGGKLLPLGRLLGFLLGLPRTPFGHDGQVALLFGFALGGDRAVLLAIDHE